jgi:hypothetical protein
MSRLPLMDGILPLMDGAKERGVMAKQFLEQQGLLVQSRLRQTLMSQLQALRERGLLGRFLYPLMRVLVYLVYQALVVLVHLRLRVRQLLVLRELQVREHLGQLRSRLTQALRSLAWQVQARWDQLRLQARRQSLSQAWQEQQGLEASPRSQVTRSQFLQQKWSDLLERLRLMEMRMFRLQVSKRPVQRVALMFGGLSMIAKQRIGQELMTARRRIGQLLTIVKHQIGKR